MTLGRVICAISGGVDSAVAALLLKRKGYDVLGVFMTNWDLTDEVGVCSQDEDRHYAQKVCTALKIPFQEVNLVKEYWVNVFQPMIENYSHGKTLNPDVLCNRHVKFDAFHRKCQNIANDPNIVIATGHYAHSSLGEGVFEKQDILQKPALMKAVDKMKDQTFFLHKITAESLMKTHFPLGKMCKHDVKSLAINSEVSFTLERKESMGICFIGKRTFKNFISNYIPLKPGEFIDIFTGKVMGCHDGIFLFTDGQRSKLSGKEESYAVVHRNPNTNEILVVRGVNHPIFFSKSVLTGPMHWISGLPEAVERSNKLRCQFRFHHQSNLVDCCLHTLDDGKCLVILDEPLRAMTVGQDAVLYLGDQCLGGAEILEVGPSAHECRDPQNVDYLSFRDAGIWRHLMDKFGPDVGAFTDNQSSKHQIDWKRVHS
uniref:Mitochondrial tRNA-specific 2-thiouridylase 1 n=1 Tax=Phallusia mammillata TaxID=59560 RepID=A0A6F9DWL5_9ASCI|nr:mitochondrial tRNA-specific 2-thiouridylase 1 [Phallusia mammillata]